MPSEVAINRFINGRAFLWIVTGLSALIAVAATSVYAPQQPPADGLFFRAADLPTLQGWTARIANGIVILLIGIVLDRLIKAFAFVREHTLLASTTFFLLTLLNPRLTATPGLPALPALIWLACTIILFLQFGRSDRLGSIFLISAILTICSMFCYPMAFFLPVILIGTMLMHMFSFKAFLAMITGVVVPIWLAYAFGWLDFSTFRLPTIVINLHDIDMRGCLPALLSAGFVIAVGTIFGASNILTLMSYRQELRAYNGFINVAAIATIIFTIVDLKNLPTYLVILNILTAVQTAHFFTIHKFPRLYIALFVMFAAYLALFVAEVLHLI